LTPAGDPAGVSIPDAERFARPEGSLGQRRRRRRRIGRPAEPQRLDPDEDSIAHRRRCTMSRSTALFAGLLLAVVIAAPAAAAQPDRQPFSFNYSVDRAAGLLCDFAYHEEGSVTGWDQVFVDGNGNYLRDTAHGTATVIHVNADTGYYLTESITSQTTFTDRTQTLRFAGQNWMLRDPSGRVVAVHSGNLTINFETGDFRATPNLSPEFAETLCPLLGGNPA
jgi:hypothetical protein